MDLKNRNMKLSIIIPVYNEEKTIEQVIKKLAKVKLKQKKEIIVVDDGSNDKTPLLIEKLKSKIKNLSTITHQKNLGKGAAIQTGVKYATGDYILIQDADLEYNPSEIPKLISALSKNQPEDLSPIKKAVYGSRFINNQAVIPFIYLVGNKFLTFFTNFLFNSRLTDMETGYKLLPSSFLKKIKLINKRFDIEPEITAKLIKNNIPIIEIPISYQSRTRFAGKKLTLMDALSAVTTLIKNRFG